MTEWGVVISSEVCPFRSGGSLRVCKKTNRRCGIKSCPSKIFHRWKESDSKRSWQK
jgi:hypothetical protein